mmetsp:Transcript_18032/g.21179  ORF Transcript_18032/g.21179 Transcript_18032/m.21179 type:complete len:96 (+) Transcript_18032:183-470(+)
MISNLETCISSTEGHLQCFKCIEIFTEPQVLIPCGHPICRTCVPGNGICPECERGFNGMAPATFLTDLALKHSFSKETVTAFRNDKTWQNALKGF